jgi:hypothetical protein
VGLEASLKQMNLLARVFWWLQVACGVAAFVAMIIAFVQLFRFAFLSGSPRISYIVYMSLALSLSGLLGFGRELSQRRRMRTMASRLGWAIVYFGGALFFQLVVR